MYSVHPYNCENVELDLPTTMYSIKPIIEQIKVNNCFFSSSSVYSIVCVCCRFNNSKRLDTGILNSYLVDCLRNCFFVGDNG